jgi:hypothetical protein
MTINTPIKKIFTESETDACNITYSDELYTTGKSFTTDPELTEEIAIYNGQFAAISQHITVEEGAVFTNSSATWKHKTTKNDKYLRLINDRYPETIIDVVPKRERLTMPPVETIDLPDGESLAIGDNSNIVIQDFKIILPDTCFCVPVPFHGYDIHIQARGNPVIAKRKNEEIALQTFREMVTEKEYRKYLRYGFINIEAASSKIYQICRENSHVRVWKSGVLLEEICVRIPDQRIPATDRVIALMIMIETDEKAFRNIGNIYKMRKAA